MSFPFEFVKSRGDFDFLSPGINLAGNAAVIAVGGVVLAAIANVALPAMGFSEAVVTVATAIPIALAKIAAVAGIVFLAGGAYIDWDIRTKQGPFYIAYEMVGAMRAQ